jgi:acyl-coenzyme A synthetase/AMP-(fatty) acid ligase/acyl carrier protein
VLVAHRSIVNHMTWMQHDFPLDERHRVLQRSPFSFDASVWEFWAPLLAGARLCLARPGLHHDTAYLKRTIVQHGITTLQLVPSLLRLMLDEDRLDECESLERVFCGGEPLTLDVQDAFFAQSRADLCNLYGPTEATVVVTAWFCERHGNRRIVPIGRPIANVEIYILDDALQPVGVNAPGELYIGGRALARGYIGRPAATGERFLPDPLASEPGARMYRSGDLARWLPDGTIEFLGRADQQVKIRGLRIELGEIEAALATHPGVRAAAAVARGDAPDQQRLAAYVVLRRSSPPSVPELGAHLRQWLPEYMVPSSIVVMPALPLSPSGKVDYRALPDPSVMREPSDAPAAPSSAGTPPSELDGVVADIWKTVLRVERVGLHDNFFDIGGHSLLVLQVHARLRKRLGREIEITDLFRYTTVHTLAQYLERTTKP